MAFQVSGEKIVPRARGRTHDQGQGLTRALNNINIIFIEKSGDTRSRKPGLFDFVLFRIDGIIHGGPEVGLFQRGMIEGCPGEIALIENGGGQVGLEPRKMQSMNRIEDRSVPESSQFANLQFSYSPFSRGASRKSFFSKMASAKSG